LYLHLGNEVVIRLKEVVGIFDLEKTSLSKNTKGFLSESTKKNNVINVSFEMPKSFIVCDSIESRYSREKRKKTNFKVYISQISTQTLIKRAVKNKKSGGNF